MKTVLFLKKRAGFPVKKSLEVLGLPSRTYHRWVVTQGKGKRPEGVLPKGHWILPEEREAILAFKRKHPSLGAKRLSFMMLDRNIAAVSPSSVWRVLQDAGLSSKWTVPDGQKAHRTGFHQPTRAHEQWHTDFAYVNLRGTHYFFTSVLDGYSRFIVHWDLRSTMTTDDVELVIQRALEAIPKGVPKPRLISDNGPQYISTEFRSYLRDQEVVHSRIRVGHPQSNGKIERFHKSLKSECIRVSPLGDLDEAREIIKSYVQTYNDERLHASLNYLTPSDYLKGSDYVTKRLEDRKMALETARKIRREKRLDIREQNRSSA